FLGGIAVAVLGHAHPGVTRAIEEQAGRLLHVSNLFHVPSQALLGERLSKMTTGGKVFFCNSGTEANEAAIKLVRKWSRDRNGEGRHTIVVLEGSFHGRTYGGLSATGQPKFHQGFEPMLPGFATIPFGDIGALGAALDAGACAFMVEPIQGESGVRMHPEGYLKEAERLCRKAGALLVADEIQTGMGRTGSFLACREFRVEPDVVTLAKGLANGLPLGALIAREDVAAAFGPGSHGSTFGGNPVCCAASLAVLDALSAPGFSDAVHRSGKWLAGGLRQIQIRRSDVVEVRGMGLMVGMEMKAEAKPIVAKCLEAGLVINAAGNVLRFLPPLNVTTDEIDRALSILADVLKEEGGKG
ncbi:MAG: acetylornithine aminotransferase, partial [Deltaproteobacteria bacterium]|nr:acetylornithine aminotransferase [Deltaproteobacteria bacterium]